MEIQPRQSREEFSETYPKLEKRFKMAWKRAETGRNYNFVGVGEPPRRQDGEDGLGFWVGLCDFLNHGWARIFTDGGPVGDWVGDFVCKIF
ncbi:MAG TPA: hypothetical protein DD473_05550 [Planctomycetaceae bacterium]|nr:hypothetical protein [Planctomycetaceae bacterium]